MKHSGIEVNTSPAGYAKCLIAKHGVETIQGISFDVLLDELMKQGVTESDAREAIVKAKQMVSNVPDFKTWCKRITEGG